MEIQDVSIIGEGDKQKMHRGYFFFVLRINNSGGLNNCGGLKDVYRLIYLNV